MNANVRKAINWIIICLVIISFSAGFARLIETDFGKVSVSTVYISDVDGTTIAAKLYKPGSATVDNKAPAVINIHGYQNDKLVDDSFSIELSRRGFVVISPDVAGHGDSTGGVSVGGVLGDPNYTGGSQTTYVFVKNLPYVDAANIGAMGHSMGAIMTERLGTLNPEINALNIQCGFAGSPILRNVLLSQARYDEFAFFREGLLTSDSMPTNANRMASFGLTNPVEWDTTYGSFDDGTARRAALIQMEHHFLPLTNKAVAEGVSWMEQALKDGEGAIPSTNQVFMVKELFGLVTLLTAIFMLIPLTNLFLAIPFFSSVAQPLPNRYVSKGSKWWLYAAINAIVGGVTYPLFTQYGALSDKVQPALPWFKLQVGNGVILWLLVNVIICGILFAIWYNSAKKTEKVTLYDMGVSFDKEKTAFNWNILGKTLLMGAILFGILYIIEGISQWALGQEFRFVWPYMRQFATPERFGLFILYTIPALLFFLVNGGLFLFGQNRPAEMATPNKTQVVWWLKACFAMLTGLLVVWMIQYLPWYLTNVGPGFEVMGLPQFSALWPLMLQVYIPEFIVLLFLHVWFFRKTGRIYLGALVIAMLMMWFLAAGSVIGLL
ncbi:MAG: alpha/beta hydrolase family protein [Anaerolineaceae bacterium]